MEGRAVPTTISDQTALVTQQISSRRIIREILDFGGWKVNHSDPREEEKALNRLRGRIRIENAKGETIRIWYRDNDPVRTSQVCNKIAEIDVRRGR